MASTNLRQWGITADTSRWPEYVQQLRDWLKPATGATSIPYRIEGLDPRDVYPRVLTAVRVQTPDGKTGFGFAHVIDVDESLLVASAQFQHEDCPKLNFLEVR